MRAAAFTALALALAPAAARAADPAPGLALAIYSQNQAVVQDQRRPDLARGEQMLDLPGVAAQARPETLILSGDGISDVEIAFMPARPAAQLLDGTVGRKVRVLRTPPGGQPTTEEGTFLGQSSSGLLVELGDHTELFNAGDPTARLLFAPVPGSQGAGPGARATLSADRAGPHLLDLSYLTGGLSWRADYVAHFQPAAGVLDLEGRFVISNTSGGTFQDAAVDLVSGSVALNGGSPFQPRAMSGVAVMAMRKPAPEMEAVGETHVYHLPGRLTLADSETRVVGFLEAQRVPARQTWRWTSGGFESADEPSHAQVVVAFANRGAAGFDQPLPEGTIRVFEPDARGRPSLVGESGIGPTPTGSELTMVLGEAYDVTVKPTLVSSQPAGRHRMRYAMTYEVRNAKSEPVTLDLRQDNLEGPTRVISESLPSRAVDAHTRAWSVPVPAGGSTTLTVDLETGGGA
jgi:hypothetical protein